MYLCSAKGLVCVRRCRSYRQKPNRGLGDRSGHRQSGLRPDNPLASGQAGLVRYSASSRMNRKATHTGRVNLWPPLALTAPIIS